MLPSSSAAAATALRLSQRLPRAVVRRPFAASSTYICSRQRTVPRLVHSVVAPPPPPRVTAAAARHLSSTSATATATASSSSTTATTTAAPVRDFFLDNLGKIFLSIIAFIIASLVRSHYGGNNLKAVRDELEEASALDPMEIDELRRVNTELTPELYKKILNELQSSGKNSGSSWTYEEFVTAVRTILRRELGPAGTIGLGYLLDRVVIAALQQYKLQDDDSNNKSTSESETTETSLMTTESASFGSTTTSTTTDLQNLSMPLAFWMTVLSLALHGPVPDRIRVLYEVLQTMPNDSEHDNDIKTVTLPQVITMVGYLQETCQLVPDKQVIPTDVKYPTQQYRKGTPRELVAWDTASSSAAKAENGNDNKKDKDALDIDAFAEILRSKSVCAWGECYFKKKFVP